MQEWVNEYFADLFFTIRYSPISIVIVFFLLTFLVLLWIATIFAATRDSIHREKGHWLTLAALLLTVCVPFLGLLIYRTLRPSQTLLQKKLAELEYRLLFVQLTNGDNCHNCYAHVEPGFTYCPMCNTVLVGVCQNCGNTIRRSWRFCSSCNTPIDDPKKVKRGKKLLFGKARTSKNNKAREDVQVHSAEGTGSKGKRKDNNGQSGHDHASGGKYVKLQDGWIREVTDDVEIVRRGTQATLSSFVKNFTKRHFSIMKVRGKNYLFHSFNGKLNLDGKPTMKFVVLKRPEAVEQSQSVVLMSSCLSWTPKHIVTNFIRSLEKGVVKNS